MTSDRYRHPSRRHGAAPAKPFFDLEVPAHAYLFGLLQADGAHSQGQRNSGCVSLELKAEDEELLRQIVHLCPWYSSVHHRYRDTNFVQGHRSVVWTLCSWDARVELAALGLPPGRKALRTRPPTQAMSERDYLRGLMDGDGSVGFTGAGRPFASFVTASEAMARYWELCVLRLTNARRQSNPTSRDGVYNPMVQNEPARDLATYLYRNGDLALRRKAVLAGQVAAWERPAGMRKQAARRRWTNAEDAVLATNARTTDLAVRLGRSPNSVATRRWRLRRGSEKPGG